MDLLNQSYDLLRGLHILAAIAWMAGMLMLPRLYVYQIESVPGGELDKKMTDAARRLKNIILNPGIVITWVFGLTLLITHFLNGFSEGLASFARVPLWFWIKFALVLILSALHGYFVGEGKKLARGERPANSKSWRIMNEAPYVLAIVIVMLAVLEPTFGFAGG